MTRASVVVGGGLSGLVAASLLARHAGGPVVLVEREHELGGLLRSFDYGAAGRFDIGTHHLGDTGITELDALIHGLLPAEEWQLLEGLRRDVSGLFYGARLQLNSPFMDLRGRPAAELAVLRSEFEAAVAENPAPAANLRDWAIARYGQAIAEAAIFPVASKLYHRAPEALDPMAAAVTPLHHVVLYDEEARAALGPEAQMRLAYPEQRRRPVPAAALRAYYPRRFGMHRVIEAWQRQLLASGVEIRTSTRLSGLHAAEGRVCDVMLERNGETFRVPVERLVWTSGLPSLAASAGIPTADLPFDRPLRTVVVSLLLDRPLLSEDLYYFYCYDPGLATMRVTNFAAYSEGAPRDGLFPVSMELLVEEAASPVALAALAREELGRMGVLAPGTHIPFARAEVLPSGFPLPTVRNASSLATLRERVAGLGLTNVTVTGILAEPGLFFQRDVLPHAYRAVMASLASGEST